MNTLAKIYARRRLATAVQAALLAMAVLPSAWAADPVDPDDAPDQGGDFATMAASAASRTSVDGATAALVQPAHSVELGLGFLSNGSLQANEYSGLKRKGAYLIGNIDLRGGGAYGSDDASRWRILGTNLGTQTRALTAEYGLQGKFSLRAGYSEWLRNRSDSYQTPLTGAGTNVLTLPSTWVIPVVPRVNATTNNARGLSPEVTASNALVSGVSTAPTPAQAAAAAALQAADLPLFQNVDLYSKRTRYDLGTTYTWGNGGQWLLSANFRHEDKVGIKAMGTVSRANGSETGMIVPDPIDNSSEHINVEAQFRGSNFSLQAAYNGSAFVNNVPSLTWSNWAAPTSVQTMSSAPASQFHQLSLTGTYSFTPSTRLVANTSYARTTQNDTYLSADYAPLVPTNSLNGLVVNKAVNLKLTSRPTTDLSLLAAYKFEDRDNRTSVNTYGFYDAGEAKAGSSPFATLFPTLALGTNINLNANRPYSKKLNQFNVEGDYQVSSGQALKAAYEVQHIDNHCDASWIACADAATSKEDTVRLEWRATAWDTVNARIGAAHSLRQVDYNEDAWLSLAPAANWAPTGAAGYDAAYGTAYSTMLALGLTGQGPASGLTPAPAAGTAAAFYFPANNVLLNRLYGSQSRISELRGLRRYNMADRAKNTLRAALDWQPTELVSLQLGADFNHERYSKSVYGLQKARSHAFNLDAAFSISESISLNTFISHEESRSRTTGNSYTANSAAAAVNGFTAIADGCFSTVALRNASNKIDPCLNWAVDARDTVDTLGASYTHKGLLSGSLELSGGVSVSQARNYQDVTGGTYANNPLAVAGAPANTTAAFYIAAAPLPTSTTNNLEFKFAGKYSLNKESAVRVGYRFQHMRTNDWMYEGLQAGGIANVLNTNEQAPSYSLHSVTVTYLHTFR